MDTDVLWHAFAREGAVNAVLNVLEQLPDGERHKLIGAFLEDIFREHGYDGSTLHAVIALNRLVGFDEPARDAFLGY